MWTCRPPRRLRSCRQPRSTCGPAVRAGQEQLITAYTKAAPSGTPRWPRSPRRTRGAFSHTHAQGLRAGLQGRSRSQSVIIVIREAKLCVPLNRRLQLVSANREAAPCGPPCRLYLCGRTRRTCGPASRAGHGYSQAPAGLPAGQIAVIVKHLRACLRGRSRLQSTNVNREARPCGPPHRLRSRSTCGPR
jgi:hypothetical protein